MSKLCKVSSSCRSRIGWLLQVSHVPNVSSVSSGEGRTSRRSADVACDLCALVVDVLLVLGFHGCPAVSNLFSVGLTPGLENETWVFLQYRNHVWSGLVDVDVHDVAVLVATRSDVKGVGNGGANA